MRDIRRLSLIVAAALSLCACASGGARPQAVSAEEIPFVLTDHNVIVVKAVLNETDQLDLMLHTAATDVTLTEDAVRKSKSLVWTDAAKVQSWGGESDARRSSGNRLRIEGLLRSGVSVWEDQYSGIGTDGKFGLDLFKGRIVEIDFDRQRIVLYDRLPAKTARYRKLKLSGDDGQWFVEADCAIDGALYRNRFLLHTGYAGGLLLDDGFVAKTGVDGKLKITDESALKDSFGNTFKVKKAVMPQLTLGGLSLQAIPTGFFSGAIGRQKMSVMGTDVLRRFNLIFDTAGGQLYLNPRQQPNPALAVRGQ